MMHNFPNSIVDNTKYINIIKVYFFLYFYNHESSVEGSLLFLATEQYRADKPPVCVSTRTGRQPRGLTTEDTEHTEKDFFYPQIKGMIAD
jgi:hypothetical protein